MRRIGALGPRTDGSTRTPCPYRERNVQPSVLRPLIECPECPAPSHTRAGMPTARGTVHTRTSTCVYSVTRHPSDARSRSSAAASCERRSRRWRHRMGLSGGTSDAAVAYGQIVRSHKSMTGASSEAMCVGSRQRSGCRLPDVDYDPGLALALARSLSLSLSLSHEVLKRHGCYKTTWKPCCTGAVST